MKLHCFRPISIDGFDYSKGVHIVDAKLAKHWYVLACVANGYCAIGEAEAPKPPAVKEVVKPTPADMGGDEYSKMIEANKVALAQPVVPQETSEDVVVDKKAAAQAKRKATLEAKKALKGK